MNISKKTLSNPVLMIVIFSLIAIMGVFTVNKVEINLWPEMNDPSLMVYATYENAGPQSVETSVTKIIEDGLVSVSNLKKMTSISAEGSSMITMQFTYGTNLDVATNEVRDAIDSIKDSLPKVVKTPSIMKFTSSSMPIMTIAVRGNRTAEELRYIADNEVKNVLKQAGGVGQASVSGGRTQIVRVELSQNRLVAFGLTVADISAKLALENLDLGGGKIKENASNFTIRTNGEYKSLKEINDTVLKTVNGYNVKLSDVGKAFMGYKDKSESVFINGTAGVYISVTKQSRTNSVKVADALYEKLAELKQSLPDDIKLEIISDDSITIRETLHTLYETAIQGILLAVIVLFIFLKSFKSTFIISISIPLSIVMTLLLMYVSGITLNIMTLTGLILGVGMVVDASIVMIDNIYAYRVRGTRAKTAAILGSQEMISSVLSGNLTTIVVFIPFLFYMKELDWIGQIAKDMIFTIVMAIVSSLFVAIFLVPVLAGQYMPLSNRTETPVRNPVLKILYAFFDSMLTTCTAVYKKLLSAALMYRKTTVITSVGALLLSFALVPFLHFELMEEDNTGAVVLNIVEPVGTSLNVTESVVQYFATVVEKEVSHYKNVVASTGTSLMEGSATENKGSVTVYVPLTDTQADSIADVKKKLSAHFSHFPSVQFTFSQGDMESIAGYDIDILVRSSDLEAASKVSKQLMAVMKNMGNLGNIHRDLDEGLPQVEIEIDRQRAALFGINVNTAATEINNSIAGVTSTKFRSNGNEYDVILMYQGDDKQNVIDLDSITVEGTNGLVSLSNFASVKKSLGPVEVKRQNRVRAIHVQAQITDGENAAVVENQIKALVKENCIIPSSVSVTYEGSWQTMQKQGSVFGQIIALAVILVFGVMAGTYGSFKAPLINMMTIPFMFIGVIVAYLLKGQAISLMTMLGLVMLVGIVVNNGIILVDYTNLLMARGKKLKEACLEAGTSRFRPVLMTTLTTVLGMLPMSFNTQGSAAMIQPIGLSVLGGLISSTFVTLLLIPVLYSLVMSEKTAAKNTYVLTTGKKDVAECNEYNGKTAAYRCEIVANQSVEDDIIDALEQELSDFQYTLAEQVYGKGLRARKLGNATWPQMNFVLMAYITEEQLETVTAIVELTRQKFAGEGIQLFVMKI
ncbi:MAG: efflux RND transporter permease subunit [Treponema sp.]|nr:efflux RND transporter permease subunit [Treponema sp.]